MRTTYLLWAVGVMVIAGAGYAFFGLKSAPSALQQGEAPQQQQAAGKFSGSMADLMTRGGNYVCTFSEKNAQSESTGTVYISGSNIRGNFESKVKVAGNMSIESHMITRDGMSYVWSSMMPTGFKMKTPAGAATGANAGAMQGGGMDMAHAYTYDCQPWTADQSMFLEPSGITFKQM